MTDNTVDLGATLGHMLECGEEPLCACVHRREVGLGALAWGPEVGLEVDESNFDELEQDGAVALDEGVHVVRGEPRGWGQAYCGVETVEEVGCFHGDKLNATVRSDDNYRWPWGGSGSGRGWLDESNAGIIQLTR